MLARALEEGGLTTVNIVLVREHAERVKPPRALWVPFPFGFALGRPNDPAYQHRVLQAALDLLPRTDVPVLAGFPDDEARDVRLVQASAVQKDSVAVDPADEVTALRAFYERWVADHAGRTAVGLCGIPQRRFRGVVRFLQSCAAGEPNADMEERPASASVPQFIRYCVDDLKAFYYEARMAQAPGEDPPALHRWFWGKTAAGTLIVALATRMNASDDPATKTIAFGMAR